jgi:hypothetical protein
MTHSTDTTADVSQDVKSVERYRSRCDGKLQAIDYNRLIETFGTRHITDDLLQHFKRATGYEPHAFMRRGLVSVIGTSKPSWTAMRRVDPSPYENVHFYDQATKIHRPSRILSLCLSDTSNNGAFPSMCINPLGLEKDR